MAGPVRTRDLTWRRQRVLHLLQQRLESDGWPRLQMALLVALTGAAGLLASFVLLQTGLHAMWLRYPIALAMAYLVFLLLLWLWLRTNASDFAPDSSGTSGSSHPANGADAPGGTSAQDALGVSPDYGSAPKLSAGGGGDFAGGGASADFDAPASKSLGDSLGSVADADEFAIPLVALLLAAGLALSSLYIVYTAPVLFAELLLDGALAATLFRRLRGLTTQHWIETAVNRTALPFVLTAVFLGLCGAALQSYAPEAHSLGDVLQHAARR